MNRAVAVFVIVIVLVGLPASVSGGGVTAETSDTVDEGKTASATSPPQGSTLVQAQDNGTDGGDDNETVRHRHPDDHGGNEGDLGGWLAGQLASRLGDGALQITEGQYETARGLLGDEYDDQLEKYIEVTGADEEEEERLRETGDKQEELADLLEEFEETREEYEQALEAGDEERARELARELVDLAERIDSVSVELQELLDEIEEITGEDLNEALEGVEEVREEVNNERERVIDESLTKTELVVETDQETMSFLDPLVASGQLQTVEGEPIANQSITLRVAGKTMTAETDANGAFTFEYRPTAISLDTESLSVTYLPASDSEYARSEDSVSIVVEQVEPTLTVGRTAETVAFTDEIRVNGTLVAGDQAVDGVPVDVVLGGQRLGTLTVTDGEFDGTIKIPATIPDGEQTLTVRLPFEDQALASVAERQPVTVSETATTLSMTATIVNESNARATNETETSTADTERGETTIQVIGTLETSDGLALDNATVDVRLDGTIVTSVQTTANGTFNEILTLPDGVNEDAVTVVVAYGGDGNLAPAQARTTVELPATATANPWYLSTTVWLGIGAGVVGLAGVGAFWWSRRRKSGEQSVPSSESDAPDTSSGATTDSNTIAVTALLEQASDHLQAGRPDRAVQTCYGAVRQHLESQLGTAGAFTHWEFYRECADRTEELGDDDSLRSVTELYEQATFGLEEISPEDGEAALERSQRLVGIENRDGGIQGVADD